MYDHSPRRAGPAGGSLVNDMEDRISAACAFTGCVLLGIGTSMHPMEADPNNAAAAFAEYAAHHRWVTAHLLQFAGAALLLSFMLILSRQLRARSGMRQVATGGAIASLAVVAALQAVDGVALKATVDAWSAAPPADKPAAFAAAFAVRQIEIGLASMLSFLFGATSAMFGLLAAWRRALSALDRRRRLCRRGRLRRRRFRAGARRLQLNGDEHPDAGEPDGGGLGRRGGGHALAAERDAGSEAMNNHFQENLLRIARQPTRELAHLRTQWPSVKSKINKLRRELLQSIDRHDPILSRVDLMSPLGSISNETTHTQALSYLLKPEENHGLGRSVLVALVKKAKKAGGSNTQMALKLLRQKRTAVFVEPEFRYAINNDQNRKIARCDIWITLRSPSGSAIIVVENKINAREGFGQLETYAREASKWCKRHRGQALLIYLAPKARTTASANGSWVCLSYLDLASALRNVWLAHRHAEGRVWLSLYINAIARGVLGFNVDRIQDTDVTDLKTYLGSTR